MFDFVIKRDSQQNVKYFCFPRRTFITEMYMLKKEQTHEHSQIAINKNKIDATKLYLVEKSSDDLSFYEGESVLNAFYASADQNFSNRFRAVYGLRFEDIDLKVKNERLGTTIANIKEMAILPSVNLTYSLSVKTNIRASYFSSVNRPEFRELAPFSFFVFEKNAELRGNSGLQIANLKSN